MPILLSGLLGFVTGRPARLSSALGFAGLVAVEEMSGLPLGLASLAIAPRLSLGGVGLAAARGMSASAAYSQLGFWGVLGACLAYEIGGAIRGDVR